MTSTDTIDKDTVVQGLIGLPIAFAVNSVLDKAIVAIVPPPAKLPAKIALKVGRFVIASVAADLITDRFVKTQVAMAQRIYTNVKAGVSDIIQDEDDAQ